MVLLSGQFSEFKKERFESLHYLEICSLAIGRKNI